MKKIITTMLVGAGILFNFENSFATGMPSAVDGESPSNSATLSYQITVLGALGMQNKMVQVSTDDTVADLKRKIENLSSYSFHSQAIVFQGRILKDDQILGNIKNFFVEKTVSLVIKASSN